MLVYIIVMIWCFSVKEETWPPVVWNVSNYLWYWAYGPIRNNYFLEVFITDISSLLSQWFHTYFVIELVHLKCIHVLPWCSQEPPTPGYSVQKTLLVRAANMGSKISLLVYEWPRVKCRIWYMNGCIFQKCLKFNKVLEKLGDLAQNLAQNWANWYLNESLFL